MDRNKFEAELIRLNRKSDRYRLLEGVEKMEITMGEGGRPHLVGFHHAGKRQAATCGWLVDTTGRLRHLVHHFGSHQSSEIRHGSSFFWVDGTVNIEKLTGAKLEQIRKRPERRRLGHAPFWLATNSFMGEGFWFWVIPLKTRTSFGLVYDNRCVDPGEVSTKEKLLRWVEGEFPLFGRELAKREIIDFGVWRNFSHDCARTIHVNRWAISGLAGRFTDPLYSPGGDAIAISNTLIVDAILTEDNARLAEKVRSYEIMMKTVYRSFVPSFHHSYFALGDQETFSMKYAWELSVYFAFYVFPFINDLLTDRYFLIPYLRRFASLGELNRALLTFITEYYQWKKEHLAKTALPRFFDFF